MQASADSLLSHLRSSAFGHVLLPQRLTLSQSRVLPAYLLCVILGVQMQVESMAFR